MYSAIQISRKIVGLYVQDNEDLAPSNTTASTIKQDFSAAIAENERISKTCNHFSLASNCTADPIMPPVNNPIAFGDPWTHYCAIDGPGKHTVVVLGNSYVARQTTAIVDAMDGRHRKIYLLSRAGCSPFDALNGRIDNFGCFTIEGVAQRLVDAVKPELIFVTQRYAPYFGDSK